MKLVPLASTFAGLGLQALEYLDAQDPARRDGRAPAATSPDVVSLLLKGGGAPTLAKAATLLYALRGLASPSHPARIALRFLRGARKVSTARRVASTVTLVAASAAVGAGVALLLAPRSGVKTRAMVRQRLENFRSAISEATGRDEEADEAPAPTASLARRRAAAR